MQVHVCKLHTRHLVRDACADNFGAVQTQDRVNGRLVAVHLNKLLRQRGRLGKAGLLHRDVDIIIRMAAACGKMSLCNSEIQIFSACGQLYHVNGHMSSFASRLVFLKFPYWVAVFFLYIILHY